MIRKYEERDLPEVLDLWYRSSTMAHSFLDQMFFEQERLDIQSKYLPITDTYVYQMPTRIVGFISMLENRIGGLFVCPEHQGNGLGTSLFKHVISQCKELEVEVFDKNIIGRSFYAKHGFKYDGYRMHEPTGHLLLKLKYPVQEGL